MKLVVCDTMDHWIRESHEELKKVLQRIEMLVINDSEARLLSGYDNIVKAARAILRMGPKMVLIKRGEYGVLQFSDSSIFATPAYPLEEVFDPTGAGDSFAGGLMGQLARTGDLSQGGLRRAIVYGSVVASFTVEDFGVKRLDRCLAAGNRRALPKFCPSSPIFIPEPMELSVVIPVYNEEENIEPLIGEIEAVLMSALGKSYESSSSTTAAGTEHSCELSADCDQRVPQLKVIRSQAQLRPNRGAGGRFGPCAWRCCGPHGWRWAKRSGRYSGHAGQTRDGNDLVAGWRHNRQDPFLNRRLPSMIANRLISWTTQVKLHDYGCTLKRCAKMWPKICASTAKCTASFPPSPTSAAPASPN